MTDFKSICVPTEEVFAEIEKQYPNCEWVEIKGKAGEPNMYFAFKPFDAQVYYSAINSYSITQDIAVRNMAMTTGHLINGLDKYQSDSEVRIYLDAYGQNMLDLTRVAFKKKPTFAK